MVTANRLWAAPLLLLLVACATGAAGDRIVVLLSIDGFPAYMFEEPRLPAPTLLRLAREGARARRMTVSNPSVTWPNHTTLVTGVPPARHGVLFNGILLRPSATGPVRVEQRDRADLVRAPTVYDLAHQAGLFTAQVDWIPHQTDGTIDWAFPERPRPTGTVERELVAAGLLTEAELADFNLSNPPWRDLAWTRAATHILLRHRPNLLLFHLLNLDSTHHKYGPRTMAGLNAIALADARVRDLLEALEAAGLRDRATVVIVSDHGFKGVTKNIRPNALFRREGLVRLEEKEGVKTVACDAWSVPEGGTAMVYVTDRAKRAALAPRLKELLSGLEGVERVIEPPEFAALGLPTPEEHDQMADLVLAAKPGYAFAASPVGEGVVEVTGDLSLGHHGYPASDPDMDGIFIAWGAGIRPGAVVERISNLDVAPTVAALLGLKMEGVSGSVRHDLLK